MTDYINLLLSFICKFCTISVVCPIDLRKKQDLLQPNMLVMQFSNIFHRTHGWLSHLQTIQRFIPAHDIAQFDSLKCNAMTTVIKILTILYNIIVLARFALLNTSITNHSAQGWGLEPLAKFTENLKYIVHF